MVDLNSESPVSTKGVNMKMTTERAKLHAVLLFSQFCHAGNHIFLRIALNSGVSKLIFPVYRNIISLLCLAPLAYFTERNQRPALTLYCVIQFFLLGLVGITLKEGFYLVGLDNTSPTFAVTMQNSIPALTFLMAAVFRFESVNLNRVYGWAKVLGVIASVAGASVITLYKGPIIFNLHSTLHQKQFLPILGDGHEKSWTLGCICLFGHCLSWSGWIVMQASVLKKFPAPFTVSAATCFFGVVQFLTLAASLENNLEAWQLNSSSEIFSVLYAGVITSGLAAALQIWTIDKGGPVFASIYLPVQIIIVALISPFVLGEEFFLGGVIGALLIISGLYLVVWGKGMETKAGKDDTDQCAPRKHLEENCENSSIIQPLIV